MQPQESLTGGGVWQRFERGAIFAPASGQPVMLHGPLWEKFQAAGGATALGLPRSDVYSYFVGPAVMWRADFADVSLLWGEGSRPNQARVVDASSSVRADYFANADLSGQPAYSRWEEGEPLFDWGEGAPGPWVGVDNFSARFTQTFAVGGVGWWYNFVVDADDGVRVAVDGKSLLDELNSGRDTYKFRARLGRGQHTLVIEYRERTGPAHLRFARSDWPATPVFAAEDTAGSFETLPVSVAASLPDLGTPIAQATAAAAGVIATLTAEANAPARPGSTPTPDNAVADAARANFEQWAAANGEPFRDAQINVTENDGFFASAQVIAWFRPARAAPWEEREAQVECRQVGGEWQCDARFAFALTRGEQSRRAQATATVVAQSTATAAAQAAATATARAAARATAVANMPAALQSVYDRFGLEFVHVAAGEFTMSSSESQIDALLDLCNQFNDNNCERGWFENATPQHTVALDDFWMGKTEVTNAQYAAFVGAGGYTQPELWSDAGWEWRENSDVTQPDCWDGARWNQPHYPVVCVNWYEAVAYAHWLARETGLPIRLPSEAEWEKAARGTDGRLWPWGTQPPDGSPLNYCDINCNIAPVGSYPAGASPYGALDMAGNVSEWTSTAWGGCDWPGPGTFAYPYRPDDGREDQAASDCRVQRGGAWNFSHYYAAAVSRSGKDPYDWYHLYGGFRVVWSASVPVP